MAATLIDATPPVDQPPDSDEVHHIVCCRNEEIALCGEDMEGAVWATEQVSTTACFKCHQADRNSERCPYGMTCPE